MYPKTSPVSSSKDAQLMEWYPLILSSTDMPREACNIQSFGLITNCLGCDRHILLQRQLFHQTCRKMWKMMQWSQAKEDYSEMDDKDTTTLITRRMRRSRILFDFQRRRIDGIESSWWHNAARNKEFSEPWKMKLVAFCVMSAPQMAKNVLTICACGIHLCRDCMMEEGNSVVTSVECCCEERSICIKCRCQCTNCELLYCKGRKNVFEVQK